MIAVIHRVAGDLGRGALPVAGKPLAVRQLQLLRAAGARKIALEYSTSLREDEVAAWLVDQALSTFVELVPSSEPLGPEEVARRAAFPSDEAIVSVGADVLFDCDLSAHLETIMPGAPVRLHGLAPSACEALPGADVRLAANLADLALVPSTRAISPGWAVALESHAAALALGLAALDGRLPTGEGLAWSIQIHAFEREPGVWIGRGANVSSDAVLTRPVLIGPDAVIKAGARIGPNAIIERSAVIERDAEVIDAVILPETVVGEGLHIEGIAASAVGLIDLDTGDCFEIDDEAMLSPREKPFVVGVSARMVALFLLLALLPIAALLSLAETARGRDIVRRARRRVGKGAANLLEPSTQSRLLAFWLRLVDVPFGRRALVGVTLDSEQLSDPSTRALAMDASRAVPGAFAIDDSLAPFDHSSESRLRGMAWYAVAKSARADLDLVVRSLRSAPEKLPEPMELAS